MTAPGIEYPRAPAHIEAFVTVLGPAGAKDFLLTFGGSEIYFSANPQARSMIATAIGRDKAAALAEALGAGSKVRVPTAKPWVAGCLHAEGLKTAEIARRLHMSDTVVRQWLKRTMSGRAAPDPRQLRLL